VPRAVVVGYSLGGAVAQLLWHRHPERVAGLVLCSTARHFQTGPAGDLWYRGQAWIAPAVRLWPGPARSRMQQAVHGKVADGPHAEWFRRELLRSDPAGLLQVGAALGRFRSNAWIGGVDVPAAVIVTTRDRTVSPRRQRALAAAIPGARTHEVAGPHNAAVSRSGDWVPTLRRALDDLTANSA
jgi:3-oxoadipate enol-lactonase